LYVIGHSYSESTIVIRLGIQWEPFEFLKLKYFDIDGRNIFYERVGTRDAIGSKLGFYGLIPKIRYKTMEIIPAIVGTIIHCVKLSIILSVIL